jgi:hypothetical protein
VPQRRQQQVRLLPVEAAPAEGGPGLDEQHRLVRRVEEVPAELVGEAPAAGPGRLSREVGQGRVAGRREGTGRDRRPPCRHRRHLRADILG